MENINFEYWLKTNKKIRFNKKWSVEKVVEFWGRMSLYKQYLENPTF